MRRYGLAILALVVIIAGLAGIKATQIKNLIAAGEAFAQAGPPPEVVSTAVAAEQTWENRLAAVGTIATGRGVTVANDAAGVVKAIRFESGAQVKQGQVLVELDSDVERAQLQSAIARRDLARVSTGRTRALVAEQAIARSQLDSDEAELKAASADAAALQAQIDRKVIRAPFDGRIGIRQVNLGQYLNPGTAIAILQASEGVFVDFTLPQEQLGALREGMEVRVNDGAPGPRATAAISAVDPTVDAVSRSIKVRAAVGGDASALRPGMFVNVSVVLPEKQKVIVIPATAVVHASFGDSIFVVEDGKPHKVARQQFVKLGEARGDFVAIAEGLKGGEEVVTSGAFKLRNGAGLSINNDVKLDPKLEPTPENR
jgi:membrane fusion protein (multidrug efflux system)